ncbi:MAG TPA: redoxin domain-containing protein [Syntrophorhabdaceae bacterium]|nr:redoxin domain-containing protein [Syntrophorhabdaceae bacterium]
MGKLIQQGEKGKSFLLKDNRDKDVQLSDFEGKKVLLSFHPLAWTSVCAKQMKALENNKKKFDRLNTVALGLSIDTVPSKNAWAKTLGIQNTRLLSDFWPHGKIAKAYGLFRAANGFSERANVILDEKHRVIFVKVYPIAQLPDLKEIFKVLSSIKE